MPQAMGYKLLIIGSPHGFLFLSKLEIYMWFLILQLIRTASLNRGYTYVHDMTLPLCAQPFT